jgi:hypothetical protein
VCQSKKIKLSMYFSQAQLKKQPSLKAAFLMD